MLCNRWQRWVITPNSTSRYEKRVCRVPLEALHGFGEVGS
jgi:hypothetical protein